MIGLRFDLRDPNSQSEAYKYFKTKILANDWFLGITPG